MKDNYIMFDAVARVDDQLIDRCANRMLQKATADDNAEREVKKEMRFSMKKVIPFAACAIIAIIIGTVLFMDPLSVFNHVSNAPDKEYEATHVRFTNVEDAAREIGSGYLFDLIEDKEIKLDGDYTASIPKRVFIQGITMDDVIEEIVDKIQ